VSVCVCVCMCVCVSLINSVFWITHPQNTFVNNTAVGGRSGFWYAFHEVWLSVCVKANKQCMNERERVLKANKQ